MAERHDDHEVDLRGASQLITGEPMSAAAQAKVYEIAAKLGIRVDDPLFSLMVGLDSYLSFFATIPDHMAAAARGAAADVGSAARDTAQRVLAEAVTSAVDMQAFNRFFRMWALVVLAGIVLITVGFGYANYRLMAGVGESAEQAYQAQASRAMQEIDAALQSTIRVSTEAATRAALAASQNTAKAIADRLSSDIEQAEELRVAESLKYGKANATEIATLLNLEKQQPGSIHNLVMLASQGWRSLVAANPTSPCGATGYDTNSGKRTCILWAPSQ